MKKTTKLVCLALSFCMVLVVAVIGVLAVQSLNLEIGGNINFTADGIKATITKAATPVTGGTLADSTNKMKQLKIDTSMTASDFTSSADYATWGNLSLEFGSTGVTTLNFTVKNDADPITEANEYILVQFGSITGKAINSTVKGSSPMAIAPGDTQNFSLTFNIADRTIDASITEFVAPLSIERLDSSEIANIVYDDDKSEYYYQGMYYSNSGYGNNYPDGTEVDQGTTYAYVGYDSQDACDVIIPKAVRFDDGEDVYVINAIDFAGSYDWLTKATKIELPNTITKLLWNDANYNALSGVPSGLFTTYNNGNYLGNDENPYMILCKITSPTGFSIHPNCKIIYMELVNYQSTTISEITIPDSVIYIDSNAFDSMYIAKLNVGKGVRTIGTQGVITNYGYITDIEVDEYNVSYNSYNNSSAMIETGSAKLAVGGANTVIPGFVKTIGKCSITNATIENFVIPSSITEIEERGLGAYITNLYIDSSAVASSISSNSIGNQGGINTGEGGCIRIKDTITATPSSWITNNFTYSETVDGYKVYQANS